MKNLEKIKGKEKRKREIKANARKEERKTIEKLEKIT